MAKLKADEAADYLRITRNHLNQLNFRGDGPPRIRISQRVYLYDTDGPNGLDAWMASRTEGGNNREVA